MQTSLSIEPNDSDNPLKKVIYLRKMTPGACKDSLAIYLSGEILQDDFIFQRANLIKNKGFDELIAVPEVEAVNFKKIKAVVQSLKHALEEDSASL